MTWDVSTWGRFVGLLGAVAGFAVACASGDQFTVGGDDGGPAATVGPGSTNVGSGGAGGAGGSTTSTSPTSSTTAGMGGMGGFMDNCDEDPCKLTAPQCGCPPGERCTLEGGVAISRTCAPDGDKAIGEVCNADCEAGGLCLGLGAAANPVTTCREHCDDDSQCAAPGGLCTLGINGSDEMFCSENCLPDSNAGCDPATACAIGREQDGAMRFFTVCVNPGPGTQNTPCTPGEDSCAATFTCVNDGTTDFCAKYCQVNNPSCIGGGTCVPLNTPQIIGGIEYGVCV